MRLLLCQILCYLLQWLVDAIFHKLHLRAPRILGQRANGKICMGVFGVYANKNNPLHFSPNGMISCMPGYAPQAISL